MADLHFWLVLTGVAFGTSIVSGILGMAGGLILLSALLWKLDPVVAVPVHGIVQLVSNASRAWFLRPHVSWKAVVRFAWPLLPAGALGLLVLQRIPAAAGRILIGAFVLVATWLPAARRKGGASPGAWRALPVGGALVGFFSTLVGATGPLLGPFIVALDLGPQATIGTLAGCQIFQHASKVLLFGAGGFDFSAYLPPTLGLCVAALFGSAVGTRWLKSMKPDTFKLVIRLVITGLALQLLVSGAVELLSPEAQSGAREERHSSRRLRCRDRGPCSSAGRHARHGEPPPLSAHSGALRGKLDERRAEAMTPSSRSGSDTSELNHRNLLARRSRNQREGPRLADLLTPIQGSCGPCLLRSELRDLRDRARYLSKPPRGAAIAAPFARKL